MTFHRFLPGDSQVHRWDRVMPGDMVVSTGTLAFKQRDFADRNELTRVLQLARAPILILSRIDGIPGEEGPKAVGARYGSHTFTALSRHGIIVIVQLAE